MTGTEGFVIAVDPWEVAGGGTTEATEGWRDEKTEREKSVLRISDVPRPKRLVPMPDLAPRSEQLHWRIMIEGVAIFTITSERLVRCFLLKRAYCKQANKADHIFATTPA